MKKERNDKYLTEKIDKAIGELVYDKTYEQKAYNYYIGVRDAEQFAYLEDNFGIGNPTSIEFTPLIKKHVDALVGEFLETPIIPKVTCKDQKTISKITREKEVTINSEVYKFLQSHLNNQILNFIDGKGIDKAIENALNQLVEDIEESFVSSYEIAAQNIIEYIIQSKDIKFQEQLKKLLTDILIYGYAFYRVTPNKEENNVNLEVLDVRNTFIDKKPNSTFAREGSRSVVRYWLTKQEVLNKYGKKLTEEAINELENMYSPSLESNPTYVRSYEGQELPSNAMGLVADKEVVPGMPIGDSGFYNYNVIAVYEVEWIEVDREGDDFVMNRYEGVKIGSSIHILNGESEFVSRSNSNPSKCYLSVGGIYFIQGAPRPYSLVLACAHLQDKYDLIYYFRDNTLANSGTTGDWIDISMLPTALGDDLIERIMKFQAYKKTGIGIIDTSQEGRAFNNNTTFAGFDDSIKVQTMQAFDLALQRVEDTCSSITGVFRERLNGIEQKDAVSNVKVGVKNSYTITKPYYQQMDLICVEMLSDFINMAKIVWKKGITGTLVLGDKYQKIFTAMPEHFTHTDYDIHIVASSQVMQDIQKMEQVIMEFIKSGQLDPDIIVDALTSKSLTELKSKIKKAWDKKKKENDALSQMEQKLQEYEKQLQSLQQEKEQLTGKIESLNEAKINIEKYKVEEEIKIKWLTAQTDKDYKETQGTNDTTRTNIELKQLNDGNPYNDEVKNV